MKNYRTISVRTVALSAVSGLLFACGGAAAAPIHLASITHGGMQGVGASAVGDGAIEFWLNFPIADAPLGRSLVVFEESASIQQGLMEITSIDDNGFDTFAALISNGTPDLLHVRAGVVGSGGNALSGSDFQLLFSFQDLVGAELSSVRFVVSDLSIQRDEDLLLATWSSFEWQFWGTPLVQWPPSPVTPAPGVGAAVLMGAGFAASRRRRGNGAG